DGRGAAGADGEGQQDQPPGQDSWCHVWGWVLAPRRNDDLQRTEPGTVSDFTGLNRQLLQTTSDAGNLCLRVKNLEFRWRSAICKLEIIASAGMAELADALDFLVAVISILPALD